MPSFDSHSIPFAGAATPMPVWLRVCVQWVKRMPMDTMCGFRVPCGWTRISKDIHFSGYRLKMIGVDALLDSAKVINRKSGGNWPIFQFVRKAMSLHCFSEPLHKMAVPPRSRPNPKPTRFGLLDKRPKAAFDIKPRKMLSRPVATQSHIVLLTKPAASPAVFTSFDCAKLNRFRHLHKIHTGVNISNPTSITRAS